MRKGQAAIVIPAVVALATFAICLTIVFSFVNPSCNAIASACETGNFTNAAYFALAHSPIETSSQVVYGKVNINTANCSGVPGIINTGNYTMNNTNGGIVMLNNLYNNTTQSIQYDYYTSAYIGGDMTCTVVNNLPIMFAIGGLVLAGMWWVLFR